MRRVPFQLSPAVAEIGLLVLIIIVLLVITLLVRSKRRHRAARTAAPAAAAPEYPPLPTTVDAHRPDTWPPTRVEEPPAETFRSPAVPDYRADPITEPNPVARAGHHGRSSAAPATDLSTMPATPDQATPEPTSEPTHDPADAGARADADADADPGAQQPNSDDSADAPEPAPADQAQATATLPEPGINSTVDTEVSTVSTVSTVAPDSDTPAEPLATRPTPESGTARPDHGDARDRLLQVLLTDPERALTATDDLQDCLGQLARLNESVSYQKRQLADVARRLRTAGLTPAQVARLAGLGEGELVSLLAAYAPVPPARSASAPRAISGTPPGASTAPIDTSARTHPIPTSPIPTSPTPNGLTSTARFDPADTPAQPDPSRRPVLTGPAFRPSPTPRPR